MDPAALTDSIPSVKKKTDGSLSRTAQRVLGALKAEANHAGTGTIVRPQADLARELTMSVRTVQRALDELEQHGHLARRRRGDGAPALITLQLSALPAPPPEVNHAEASDSVVSDRFRGDQKALDTAIAVVVKLRRQPQNAVALATEYLEYAGGPERARIGELLDDYGMLPMEVRPTGHALLDEGLRTHFAIAARRRHQNRVLRRNLGLDD